MSPETKHCRLPKALASGAEIIRSWTENGKRMPVDADPREDGQLSMLTEYPDGSIEAAYVTPTLFEEWDVEAPEPRRFVSHFAICKQSKDWRRS